MDQSVIPRGWRWTWHIQEKGLAEFFFGGKGVVNLWTVLFWVLVTAAVFFGLFNEVCIFECFTLLAKIHIALNLCQMNCALERKRFFFFGFLSVLSGKVFWGSFTSTQLS